MFFVDGWVGGSREEQGLLWALKFCGWSCLLMPLGKLWAVVASGAALIPFTSFWFLFHFGNERKMSEGDTAGVGWHRKVCFYRKPVLD